MKNKHLQQPMRFLSSYQSNNEIDLNELLLTLWQGKVAITLCTFLFMMGAFSSTSMQPNVYESKSILLVDTSRLQLNLTSRSIYPYVSSKEIKTEMMGLMGEDSGLNGINVAILGPNQIVLSQQGEDPEVIYRNLSFFVTHVNSLVKKNERQEIEITLKPTKQLIESTSIDAVKDVLAEKYAQQLYSVALLEQESTKIVSVVMMPLKATQHIKPKRDLIVILGGLFGWILSAAAVLIWG
ncbi:Wzz/FepE/Etk N-terminal domain-containing protein, partial [Aliivibrio sp. SR45-2]|uniref:Wzz/FepE/Etk N-terminal domain-containing protein n=1 Tax=Aliivibrio sp. SR45-2 TaxID=2760931 RepID=UPI0015FC095F